MINLQKVDSQNILQLLALQVHESQRGFVADNRRSMEEAAACTKAGGYACPFGIYDGDTPVGFLMIGYGVDDDWENPPAIAFGNYSLWRLMIDRNHQGKGYGRQALKLTLDFYPHKTCGGCGMLLAFLRAGKPCGQKAVLFLRLCRDRR